MREANAVLRNIPQELRSAEHGVPAGWMADPVRPRRARETAVRTLIAVPADTPSLRLLADQTARVLAGISDALNGLALLGAAPVSPVPRRRGFRLRVPDWLPSLVNAGRAFAAIGIVGVPVGAMMARPLMAPSQKAMFTYLAVYFVQRCAIYTRKSTEHNLDLGHVDAPS
jgi:hypothetical protein